MNGLIENFELLVLRVRRVIICERGLVTRWLSSIRLDVSLAMSVVGVVGQALFFVYFVTSVKQKDDYFLLLAYFLTLPKGVGKLLLLDFVRDT